MLDEQQRLLLAENVDLVSKHIPTQSKYETNLNSKRTSLNSTHSFVLDKMAAHEVSQSAAVRMPLQEKLITQALAQGEEPEVFLMKKYGLNKDDKESGKESIEAIAQRTRSYLASLDTRFPRA